MAFVICLQGVKPNKLAKSSRRANSVDTVLARRIWRALCLMSRNVGDSRNSRICMNQGQAS